MLKFNFPKVEYEAFDRLEAGDVFALEVSEQRLFLKVDSGVVNLSDFCFFTDEQFYNLYSQGVWALYHMPLDVVKYVDTELILK